MITIEQLAAVIHMHAPAGEVPCKCELTDELRNAIEGGDEIALAFWNMAVDIWQLGFDAGNSSTK